MKKFFVYSVIIFMVCFTAFAMDPDRVELKKINDQLWVHISYFNTGGSLTPSNGLLALSSRGLILVDTPWTNKQTETLLELVREKFQMPVQLAIVTHWHQDRIGGIDTLIKEHIETVSNSLTAKLAAKGGYPEPKTLIDFNGASQSKPLKAGDTSIEIYYPGPAHSLDNTIVYFPGSKVLFGGCTVKAKNSPNLGNVADGDPVQYPASIRNLMQRYPDAKVVIPGHGDWGDFSLLEHTLQLADHR